MNLRTRRLSHTQLWMHGCTVSYLKEMGVARGIHSLGLLGVMTVVENGFEV